MAKFNSKKTAGPALDDEYYKESPFWNNYLDSSAELDAHPVDMLGQPAAEPVDVEPAAAEPVVKKKTDKKVKRPKEQTVLQRAKENGLWEEYLKSLGREPKEIAEIPVITRPEEELNMSGLGIEPGNKTRLSEPGVVPKKRPSQVVIYQQCPTCKLDTMQTINPSTSRQTPYPQPLEFVNDQGEAICRDCYSRQALTFPVNKPLFEETPLKKIPLSLARIGKCEECQLHVPITHQSLNGKKVCSECFDDYDGIIPERLDIEGRIGLASRGLMKKLLMRRLK